MDSEPPADERILVGAPFGRDAALLLGVLRRAGMVAHACAGAELVPGQIDEGTGALLLTEDALTPGFVASLLAALSAQPVWSDIPLILLAGGALTNVLARQSHSPVDALRSVTNVTVIERPVRAVTLVTAVRAALRARRRQYVTRELMKRESEARSAADVARVQAENASRLKDEFLATVSHELRTPLSAILLWTRLATRGRLEAARIQEALHAIELSAEAQSRLIEDLLDSARITSGKIRLALAEADLRELALHSAEVVRPAAAAKGIGLHLELGDACSLRLDPERIQQVLWNLLSNAVKFTPRGGTVRVRIEKGEARARLQVTDSGQGISGEFLPYVFDRFRQGDASVKRGQTGLGLGLAISRELVELHGGTLSAASRGEGLGATFTMDLPVSAAPSCLHEDERVPCPSVQTCKI